MSAILRLAGWLSVLAIAALSLVPGDFRPHTGISGLAEHFAAYFGTASLLTLGYWQSAGRRAIGPGLMVYAGLMEVAQLWIPGRNGQLIDFAVSSLGAFAAVILILAALSSEPVRRLVPGRFPRD